MKGSQDDRSLLLRNSSSAKCRVGSSRSDGPGSRTSKTFCTLHLEQFGLNSLSITDENISSYHIRAVFDCFIQTPTTRGFSVFNVVMRDAITCMVIDSSLGTHPTGTVIIVPVETLATGVINRRQEAVVQCSSSRVLCTSQLLTVVVLHKERTICSQASVNSVFKQINVYTVSQKFR